MFIYIYVQMLLCFCPREHICVLKGKMFNCSIGVGRGGGAGGTRPKISRERGRCPHVVRRLNPPTTLGTGAQQPPSERPVSPCDQRRELTAVREYTYAPPYACIGAPTPFSVRGGVTLTGCSDSWQYVSARVCTVQLRS